MGSQLMSYFKIQMCKLPLKGHMVTTHLLNVLSNIHNNACSRPQLLYLPHYFNWFTYCKQTAERSFTNHLVNTFKPPTINKDFLSIKYIFLSKQCTYALDNHTWFRGAAALVYRCSLWISPRNSDPMT